VNRPAPSDAHAIEIETIRSWSRDENMFTCRRRKQAKNHSKSYKVF